MTREDAIKKLVDLVCPKWLPRPVLLHPQGFEEAILSSGNRIWSINFFKGADEVTPQDHGLAVTMLGYLSLWPQTTLLPALLTDWLSDVVDVHRGSWDPSLTAGIKQVLIAAGAYSEAP